jgi:RHS repeat-associated protein
MGRMADRSDVTSVASQLHRSCLRGYAGQEKARCLNTPRLIADSTGATVWRHDNTEPFSDSVPDESPSGLGAFEFPLRVPGQYADAETGLHYNYFRDYSPALGQYVQSDPVGLGGGINTYAYVVGQPLTLVDSRGLATPDTVGGAVGQQGVKKGASLPAAVGGEVCASKIACESWRRFPFPSIYEQCKSFEFEVTGAWQRECQDVCADRLRKKCQPPQSCLASDPAT